MITIEEAYIRAMSTEDLSLSKIAIPDEQYFYYGFLKQPNLLYACYHLVHKDGIDAVKNKFYTVSLLYAFLYERYDNGANTSDNIFTTHYGFCYSIISDNKKLIDRYCRYRNDFLDTFGSAFDKAIQATVTNDDITLEYQVKSLEKHTGPKSIAKNYIGVAIAFKGILKKDKQIIEQGLSEILVRHDKQEHQPVVKEFLNIEALTIAKLAYRTGIEVEVNNPLVPKELLLFQPLEQYDPTYEFLKAIE